MIYLDNAATTRYLPPEVLKAFIEECTRKSNPGRGGHNDSINSALKIQKVREIVCNYFNNKDGETVFTTRYYPEDPDDIILKSDNAKSLEGWTIV